MPILLQHRRSPGKRQRAGDSGELEHSGDCVCVRESRVRSNMAWRLPQGRGEDRCANAGDSRRLRSNRSVLSRRTN